MTTDDLKAAEELAAGFRRLEREGLDLLRTIATDHPLRPEIEAQVERARFETADLAATLDLDPKMLAPPMGVA